MSHEASMLACQLTRHHAAVHKRARENIAKQTDLPDSLSRLQLAKLRPGPSGRISRPFHCVCRSVALSGAMPLLVLMRYGIFAIRRTRC